MLILHFLFQYKNGMPLNDPSKSQIEKKNTQEEMVLCTTRRSGASLPKGAGMQVLAEFKISTWTAQELGNLMEVNT